MPEVLAIGFVGGVPGAQQGLQQQHGQELALKGRAGIQAAQQQPREPPRPCSHWLQSCRGQKQGQLLLFSAKEHSLCRDAMKGRRLKSCTLSVCDHILGTRISVTVDTCLPAGVVISLHQVRCHRCTLMPVDVHHGHAAAGMTQEGLLASHCKNP